MCNVVLTSCTFGKTKDCQYECDFANFKRRWRYIILDSFRKHFRTYILLIN